MNTQATPKTQEPTNSDQFCQLLLAFNDDLLKRLDRISQKLSTAKESERASTGAALN